MAAQPAACAGVTAVRTVADTTRTFRAFLPPMSTADTCAKRAPRIVTVAPPPAGPAGGVTDVTDGRWPAVMFAAVPVAAKATRLLPAASTASAPAKEHSVMNLGTRHRPMEK